MPQRIKNGQGATALGLNTIILRTEGYSVASGCGVTIGGSLDEIELQVGAGSIYHDGQLRPVEEQSVTLQPNVSTNYRKDLVWIDRESTARVRQGVADASSTKPPDKEAENTAIPEPPDAARLNGVPLFEIWVPPGATSSGDLNSDYTNDRRMGAGGSGSTVETRSDDPPDEELLRTRMWYNQSTEELKLWKHNVREKHIINTTIDSEGSPSGPTELVVEDFENSIADNWRGGNSELGYDTPAFEGDAAGSWDNNRFTRDYSLKGDGLDYYAEDGDRIRLAVRFDSGSERFVWLGFGKDGDDYYSGYRARLTPDGTLRVQVSDSTGDNVDTLGSASASITTGEWYVIEVDYDGGGRGVHPARLFSTTDDGSLDNVLAEIPSPTANDEHRGTGYVVCMHAGSGETRVDRLSVIPGGG